MTLSSPLTVQLAERSYPIFIGMHLLSQAECLAPYIQGRQLMIVTNERVAPLYLAALEKTLAHLSVESEVVILPDGEQHKNLATLEKIYSALLEKKQHRSTTLIALGGGVVGDMTGFAAATYQRGVPFIQVPTTLLAQVDSSVGGKTGVNHPLGKNMIGAFYQPMSVVIDLAVLKTLPPRELAAGLAEVIKYGLIYDQDFFLWIENSIDALLQLDEEALMHAVRRSCEIKAEIVASDERESGIRAILNFGHTFGHAIEGALGYGTYLHGEAVAIGMRMAAELSVKQGWLEESWLQRIKTLLSKAGLPIQSPTEMTQEQWFSWMSMDKKVMDKKVRLVLLQGCGQAIVTDQFDHDLLQQVLTA